MGGFSLFTAKYLHSKLVICKIGVRVLVKILVLIVKALRNTEMFQNETHSKTTVLNVNKN